MNWLDEVQNKLKRKNQILFSKDSEFLADLNALILVQNRKTLVLWALELADETAKKLLEKHPDEYRPMEAVFASRDWAAGKVKMPFAQRAILDAHAFAKEISSAQDIALCHAVGQACGVVHTPGHALGFPMYELTALVHEFGIDRCKEPIEARKQHYIERIYYWQENYKSYTGDWASFIKD